jgi:hypothetical protein
MLTSIPQAISRMRGFVQAMVVLPKNYVSSDYRVLPGQCLSFLRLRSRAREVCARRLERKGKRPRRIF